MFMDMGEKGPGTFRKVLNLALTKIIMSATMLHVPQDVIFKLTIRLYVYTQRPVQALK